MVDFSNVQFKQSTGDVNSILQQAAESKQGAAHGHSYVVFDEKTGMFGLTTNKKLATPLPKVQVALERFQNRCADDLTPGSKFTIQHRFSELKYSESFNKKIVDFFCNAKSLAKQALGIERDVKISVKSQALQSSLHAPVKHSMIRKEEVETNLAERHIGGNKVSMFTRKEDDKLAVNEQLKIKRSTHDGGEDRLEKLSSKKELRMEDVSNGFKSELMKEIRTIKNDNKADEEVRDMAVGVFDDLIYQLGDKVEKGAITKEHAVETFCENLKKNISEKKTETLTVTRDIFTDLVGPKAGGFKGTGLALPTMEPEVEALIKDYDKAQGQWKTWQAGEEKTITYPIASDPVLDKLNQATDKLIDRESFKNALTKYFSQLAPEKEKELPREVPKET